MAAIRIRRLRRAEFPSDTVELARWLIGKVLVHELAEGRASGRIVETEAYPPGDASAHHFRGPTPRNRSLYLRRAHAYVYTMRGLHLFNVSSDAKGVGAGVLVRALEPLEGVSAMQQRRGTEKIFDLARGPGCLGAAMAIDLRHDGVDLCARGALWLGAITREGGAVAHSVRIGITREAHRLLRFYERGSEYVSGPRRLRG